MHPFNQFLRSISLKRDAVPSFEKYPFSMAAIRVIHDLVQADSQFVIATHSPIVMAYPDSKIYELTEESIREVKYQETEHSQITRAFLSSPESALKELLEDGDSKISP